MNTQQLWQSQSLDAPRISLAFVRQRSDSLRRWAWMRNALNYVGVLAFTPFIVWQIGFLFSRLPLVSVAVGVMFVTGVLMTYRWHKRAASQEQPAELGVLDALKFHRRQLERQRDVRLDRWRRWPAIPGFLLMLVAMLVEVTPTPWIRVGMSVLFATVVLTIAIVIEERIARRIQKEIDALDSL
ncbi:MAG: hypothetical protein ABI821_15795 [Pseudomonadota bacterium]